MTWKPIDLNNVGRVVLLLITVLFGLGWYGAERELGRYMKMAEATNEMCRELLVDRVGLLLDSLGATNLRVDSVRLELGNAVGMAKSADR